MAATDSREKLETRISESLDKNKGNNHPAM